MLKRFINLIRNKRGAALVSVVLALVVLSIIGVSLTAVSMYSHKKSINNWEYEQAHYIARSSAISIRDYAKSVIDEITRLDGEIQDVEYDIEIESTKEFPNLDPLIDLRNELIEKSNIEKSKIEAILTTGTNTITATGRILSDTEDDFEATIVEIEAGEEVYSNRKYKVTSRGKFMDSVASATVYINYKPIDEYLPYLGPTPDPSGYGGFLDSFVFYSEVKTIMDTHVDGDISILRSTTPISATGNVVTGKMYVGSFNTEGGVFSQEIRKDLIAPHSLIIHGGTINGAAIVDGDFKTGVGTEITDFISANGNVIMENGASTPIVYAKGNLSIGDGVAGASVTGFDIGNGEITAALAEGSISITNSGNITGNIVANEDISVLRGVITGNIATPGRVSILQTDTKIKGNVIGNNGVFIQQATVEGDIHSQSDVVIQMATIIGDTVAKGDITLPSGYWGGTINGDLISHGNIRIEHGGVLINGDIIAQGDIYIDGGAQVTGEIISIGGTIVDNRWGDKSANYKNPPSVTSITTQPLKAERIEVELPRIEDTVMTVRKFDKFTIPEHLKSDYADVYKEDDKTIVINSSGKINPEWFNTDYGNAVSLLGKDGPWGGVSQHQTLIIDATFDDIDLYLNGTLNFGQTILDKVIIRGNNMVRLLMDDGSAFNVDGAYVTSEINQYSYVNAGLVPPNFYIFASAAEFESDIPKITFGRNSLPNQRIPYSEKYQNAFEGYIISPSSNITIVSTRILGGVVSDSVDRLHASDLTYYNPRFLDKALEGLNYQFKLITVDRNGIREENMQ